METIYSPLELDWEATSGLTVLEREIIMEHEA